MIRVYLIYTDATENSPMYKRRRFGRPGRVRSKTTPQHGQKIIGGTEQKAVPVVVCLTLVNKNVH